jgi:uncharacterized membrane protein YdjX (TVP38/TMEM64 family)
MPDASHPRRRWPLVLGLLLVAAALLLGGRALGGALTAAVAQVEALGVWGPAAFVALYVVACVLAIPGSALTLAAGAAFGLVGGLAASFAGAMLGSTAAFLVARHGARARLAARFADDARFDAIDRAVAARGRTVVFLLRLSPAIPFSLLNYALGLTRVPLRDYVLGGVGMLPGTLLYVYYGKVAGDVAALAGQAAAPRDAGYYAVLGLGLVATIAVTVLVTRVARRALAEAAPAVADAPATGAQASPPAPVAAPPAPASHAD